MLTFLAVRTPYGLELAEEKGISLEEAMKLIGEINSGNMHIRADVTDRSSPAREPPIRYLDASSA